MSDRIIKIHKRESPYAQIDKDILRNEKLSWKAKGLLAYLLSLPHDWKVHLNEVVKHSTDGATSTRSAFKELRESGYVRKVSTRDDKGQITGWETIVYEVPILETKSTDDRETTLSEKPDVENRHSGESHTTNKDCTNNDLLIKNNIYIPYREIIEHLNLKAGTNYKHSTKSNQKHIHARWEEGYRLEDFIKVIDNKVADWLGDVKYSKYLRPETLFGTKFEGYLNKPKANQQVNPQPTNRSDTKPLTSNDDPEYLEFLRIEREKETQRKLGVTGY